MTAFSYALHCFTKHPFRLSALVVFLTLFALTRKQGRKDQDDRKCYDYTHLCASLYSLKACLIVPCTFPLFFKNSIKSSSVLLYILKVYKIALFFLFLISAFFCASVLILLSFPHNTQRCLHRYRICLCPCYETIL